MQASININKIITVVTNNNVITYPMAGFASAVCKYNHIKIATLAKPKKLAKYLKILTVLGFVLETEVSNKNAGFEGKNSDVMDYIATYKKA